MDTLEEIDEVAFVSPRITNKDMIILLLKVMFTLYMMTFGLLGIIIVVLVFYALNRAILKVYDLHPLNQTDRTFFYDERN
jgi:hypothetical protein